jgi:hypothetical protein
MCKERPSDESVAFRLKDNEDEEDVIVAFSCTGNVTMIYASVISCSAMCRRASHDTYGDHLLVSDLREPVSLPLIEITTEPQTGAHWSHCGQTTIEVNRALYVWLCV